MRQKEKRGQSRETDREERSRPVHNRSEDGRPSSLPKGPRNIAESGEGQRRRGIEAPWEWGAGEVRSWCQKWNKPQFQLLTDTCRSPPPQAASTSGFHKRHSPHKPYPSPPPYPWTQAIHPNTGGKAKLFKVSVFSVSPAPNRGAC